MSKFVDVYLFTTSPMNQTSWPELKPLINGYARLIYYETAANETETMLTRIIEGELREGEANGYARIMKALDVTVGYFISGVSFGKTITYH